MKPGEHSFCMTVLAQRPSRPSPRNSTEKSHQKRKHWCAAGCGLECLGHGRTSQGCWVCEPLVMMVLRGEKCFRSLLIIYSYWSCSAFKKVCDLSWIFLNKLKKNIYTHPYSLNRCKYYRTRSWNVVLETGEDSVLKKIRWNRHSILKLEKQYSFNMWKTYSHLQLQSKFWSFECGKSCAWFYKIHGSKSMVSHPRNAFYPFL